MSQLTFTTEDVKNLQGFLSLLRDNARFDLDMEESVMLSRYVQFMRSHIKKVNDHVMEFRGVVQEETK